MRKIGLALASASLMVLTACGASTTDAYNSDPNKTPAQKTQTSVVEIDSGKVEKVTIDGTTCIVYYGWDSRGGISCDWSNSE